MNILVLGYDGYIGFPLCISLLRQGHNVVGVDNYVRRELAESLTDIENITSREELLTSVGSFTGLTFNVEYNYHSIIKIIQANKIDTIIHLAEQPSAPFSMQDLSAAAYTQKNNVLSTLNILWAIKNTNPDIHLIKLGSMGEFGTPDCKIPEGMIPKKCIAGDALEDIVDCPMSGLMFPRKPTSFYHISKVMSTYNIEFCCRNWGLRSTDIMQGVVYGLNYDQIERDVNLITRFDYDEQFGTVINRFCTQAIAGIPLTIYGAGTHVRSFLTLEDSIKCIGILITNPPEAGEYRSVNQFGTYLSIEDMALIVYDAYYELFNSFPEITRVDNPRNEMDKHIYRPEATLLYDKGYRPDNNVKYNTMRLLEVIKKYKHKINIDVIKPITRWE